jgi:LETM1 and EF-hand domain-containing protein 1
MPKTVPAIAILIPRRFLATETSTTSNLANNLPPPGFNVEQAKKPLPKEEQQKSQEKNAAGTPDVTIPKDAPTSHPKTAAQEAQHQAELAAHKAGEDGKDEKKALTKKEEEKIKLTLWQKVKKEAAHYWDGTKLLTTEVRISSKLALKMTAGYELTRREHRQVCHPSNCHDCWLMSYSCNEQSRILDDWCPSPSFSSFLLPNCFYQ